MAAITNWTDTGAATTTMVAIPEFGGIMLSSDGLVFPWSGNNPDSETQCFSYNTQTNTVLFEFFGKRQV